MIKTITTLLLVFFSFTNSFSQTTLEKQQKNDCPPDKPRALRGICNHVIKPELFDNELSYVTHFKKAAGVTPEDSEEEMYRKIREVWNKYEDCLICDTMAFEIRGGSILKAASISANKIFYNTILKWGVNLNRIDTVDGRTVLDYFRDEMAKNPPNIEFYRAYYNVLKEHGAKHAAEILAEKQLK
ncbi:MULTISPECIES: hypothetical protein [unclassified Chryseobacterium]|uniref:hypothetical protein n=1 Tax=Chryseobacterium sp. R2A-55 TaxID=2744445 RepID=UPI001F1F5BAA|nr:hypothetical protein [Chryseobacterium sp. R2A-55]